MLHPSFPPALVVREARLQREREEEEEEEREGIRERETNTAHYSKAHNLIIL
jgi:hypothetical protein